MSTHVDAGNADTQGAQTEDAAGLVERLEKRASTLNGHLVGASDGATYAIGAYDQFAAKDDRAAASLIQSQAARIAELGRGLIDVTASLVAAHSLLSRSSKTAAPSDKMFDQMLADYQASIDRARSLLNGERKG